MPSPPWAFFKKTIQGQRPVIRGICLRVPLLHICNKIKTIIMEDSGSQTKCLPGYMEPQNMKKDVVLHQSAHPATRRQGATSIKSNLFCYL